MLTFTKSRWVGNKWASIEIDPVDQAYFLPVLHYFMTTHNLPKPRIIDGIDGYITDFKIDSCEVYMHIDTWSFSLAFEHDAIRDKVFDEISKLPEDHF